MFITNAQGNYNQGRGADGLSAVRASRYGAGTPERKKRARHAVPASLDPTLLVTRDIQARPISKPLPGLIFTPPNKRIATAARRPNRATQIRHRRMFVNWLKNWAPQVYADAKRKADQIEVTDGTLGQLAGWWETFSDSVGSLGGKYLQFKTQKEILDAQMERMRQGQPPLQTSEYAPTVAVKPDAGTTREITGAIGAGFGSMLPWLAAGGVGLYLLTRRK